MPKKPKVAKVTYKTDKGEFTEELKLDEKQPNLFGEVDDIINVLELELADLKFRRDKIIDAIESSQEKLDDLNHRVASVGKALDKTRKMASKKVKAGGK